MSADHPGCIINSTSGIDVCAFSRRPYVAVPYPFSRRANPKYVDRRACDATLSALLSACRASGPFVKRLLSHFEMLANQRYDLRVCHFVRRLDIDDVCGKRFAVEAFS